MNVIELLSQLVVTKYGYDYMESEGIIDAILRKLDEDIDVLGAQLCEPGGFNLIAIKGGQYLVF